MANPSAFSGVQPSPWLPADNGLLLCSGDPATAGSTALLTAGQLLLARLPARISVTLSTLWFQLSAAGVGASTGSFAGVYSAAGVLLSGSADIGTQMVGTGAQSVPLSAPVPVAAGSFVWAAIVVNLATTQPTLQRWASSSAIQGFGGVTPASFRFAVNGAGLSALPGSITPASNSGTANALLIGAA